ncbi:hypothetical protein [Sphingomonas sp. XXL09]|uniref:hypothetical protein n=1 Tax=Sphingomonas sp. XXL09 TaxID=3457787 RepID=UPI00406B9F4C
MRRHLTEAAACRILGCSRRPIEATTLKMDRSRIDTHVRPIIGHRLVAGLTRRDIENLQADIAAGRSAAKRKGRGGRTKGGIGVARRIILMLLPRTWPAPTYRLCAHGCERCRDRPAVTLRSERPNCS